MAKEITSSKNPIFKEIGLLQKKRSARKKEGLFIIEGIKQVNEIPSHYEIKYLITSTDFDHTQVHRLEDKKWLIVSPELFKQISDTTTPQGVMAVVYAKSQLLESLEEKENPFYIILENIQDPGNLGTIIRSAYGFGAHGVILSKGCVDVYSPKTLRAAMGANFHIPIITECDLEEVAVWLRNKGIQIYATALEDSIVNYKVNYDGGVALIIGNEANGVSQWAKEIADQKIAIPMPGGLESLNASIAASICLYEVMKQRQEGSLTR